MKFGASGAWMDEVLHCAFDRVEPLPSSKRSPCRAWPLLSLLLTHEGSTASPHFMRSAAEAAVCTDRMRKFLSRVQHERRFIDVLRAFNAAFGDRLLVRSSAVYIRSRNMFTAKYEPPAADRARKAIEELFSRTAALRERIGSSNLLALVATLEYSILLTIHPLADGNGRLSRLLFASRVSDLSRASLALALVKLHRSRGRAFHLAMQALRMGSSEMILEEFATAARLAVSEHGDTVCRIESLLESTGVSEAVMSEMKRLHQWTCRELAVP